MPHRRPYAFSPVTARARSLILSGVGLRLAGAASVSGLLWAALWLVVG